MKERKRERKRKKERERERKGEKEKTFSWEVELGSREHVLLPSGVILHGLCLTEGKRHANPLVIGAWEARLESSWVWKSNFRQRRGSEEGKGGRDRVVVTFWSPGTLGWASMPLGGRGEYQQWDSNFPILLTVEKREGNEKVEPRTTRTFTGEAASSPSHLA